MRVIYILKIVVCLSYPIAAWAQDPQFSQYFNAPLYLNPAFAGTGENTRLVFNYRSQWPGIATTTPYSTTAFSFDHNIESLNSGVGLLITRDRQGAGNLSATQVSLLYAYQVELNSKWSFRPALQAGIVSKSFNYSNLTFGDQLTPSGLNGNTTVDNLAGGNSNKLYPDVSAGALLYSNVIWVGVSTHHLNMPNQSFSGNTFSLPIKASLQAGMKIPFGAQATRRGYSIVNAEKSFLPSMNFKLQGKFTQLDLGASIIVEPIMLGLYYRGIPLNSYAGSSGNESVIALIGLHFHQFSFGYSYDFTISQLALRNSGGAHEISLIYEWEIPYPKKKSRRPIPCPRFYTKNKSAPSGR